MVTIAIVMINSVKMERITVADDRNAPPMREARRKLVGTRSQS